MSWGKAPTSSRKIVPPFADSNRPRRRCVAPVNAPFSWPKSSEAISDGGIAAQFTAMNARSERLERLWIARAINSLPVPVSPKIKTVESEGARDHVGRDCMPGLDNDSRLSSLKLCSFAVVTTHLPEALRIDIPSCRGYAFHASHWSHHEGPKIRCSRFHQYSVARARFALRSGAAAPSRRG